jgi:hypothetical protein
MKLIKAFSMLFFIWTIVCSIYFGPALLLRLAENNWNITEKVELHPYAEYVVVDLKTDLFGNWVIAKKGNEKVVLKCTDSIFAELEMKKKIGN